MPGHMNSKPESGEPLPPAKPQSVALDDLFASIHFKSTVPPPNQPKRAPGPPRAAGQHAKSFSPGPSSAARVPVRAGSQGAPRSASADEKRRNLRNGPPAGPPPRSMIATSLIVATQNAARAWSSPAPQSQSAPHSPTNASAPAFVPPPPKAAQPLFKNTRKSVSPIDLNDPAKKNVNDPAKKIVPKNADFGLDSDDEF